MNKRPPDLSKAIQVFISGQSITYGSYFLLYALTADKNYLIDNRWIFGLGGLALFFVGYEGFVKKMKEDYEKQKTILDTPQKLNIKIKEEDEESFINS